MLDGNYSFDQRPPIIDNSFDDSHMLSNINNSISNSLARPNALALSHDEQRKKQPRPTSMQSVITPLHTTKRNPRGTSNMSGGLNKSTYMRNTSAFSVI